MERDVKEMRRGEGERRWQREYRRSREEKGKGGEGGERGEGRGKEEKGA